MSIVKIEPLEGDAMYLIWNQLLPVQFSLALIMTKLISDRQHCFGGGESGIKANRP